jgi:hypothetical protein
MRYVLNSATFPDHVIDASSDGAAMRLAIKIMASRPGEPRPYGQLRVEGPGRFVATIEPQPYKRGEAAATSGTDDPNAPPEV